MGWVFLIRSKVIEFHFYFRLNGCRIFGLMKLLIRKNQLLMKRALEFVVIINEKVKAKGEKIILN